jgi:hypothetical protein
VRPLAKLVGNYDDPRSLGSTMRRRRAAPLARLIERIYLEKGHCSIADLGGTERYWNVLDPAFLRRHACRITLVNLSTPPIKNAVVFDSRRDDVTAVATDDNSFDIVHSNSVLEHLGDWRHMLMFSAEVRRLAPRYFVQTPNFWFPWEPHFGTLFFHYLPRPMQLSLLQARDLGFFTRCADLSDAIAAIDSIRLLDAKMMRYLFPEARIVREKFFGLTKSLIAIKQ